MAYGMLPSVYNKLMSLIGKPIVLKLKNGSEYRGILESIVDYEHLVLTETEEYFQETRKAQLGRVVVPGIECSKFLFLDEDEKPT